MTGISSYSFGSSGATSNKMLAWANAKIAERDRRLSDKRTKMQAKDFEVLVQFQRPWFNYSIFPGLRMKSEDMLSVSLEVYKRLVSDGAQIEVKEVS